MKKVLLLLVSAAVLLGLSGCICVSGEDHHFHHDRGPRVLIWEGPHGHGPHGR